MTPRYGMAAICACPECQNGDASTCSTHGVGTPYFEAQCDELRATPGYTKLRNAVRLYAAGDIDATQVRIMLRDGMHLLVSELLDDGEELGL